ncbi:MAG: co-chaperone DjlA [Gammaproteobacteria bacterium]|jgi:DnaJ like chaperone protein|nr:co-chaperone DjlA [Gammaproteobacteria bacterium]
MNTRWLGKIIGGLLGLLASKGSLLGLALGVLLGHQFDKGFGSLGNRDGFSGLGRVSPAQRRRVFFETLFLAMGHLAKADGRVSEAEIQAARTYMHQMRLGPAETRAAMDLFNRGKQPEFRLDAQIRQLREGCQGQPALIRNFLEVLMDIALTDGGMSTVERELLWRMAAGLGVNRVEMAQFEAVLRAQRSFRQGGRSESGPPRSREQDLRDAYKALNVEPDASDKEVKTAYRRLMNQHHPDKLVAKGLPPSMMEAAEARTREIRKAYEIIRDVRGIR